MHIDQSTLIDPCSSLFQMILVWECNKMALFGSQGGPQLRSLEKKWWEKTAKYINGQEWNAEKIKEEELVEYVIPRACCFLLKIFIINVSIPSAYLVGKAKGGKMLEKSRVMQVDQ